MLQEGKSVGKYQIVRRIATGGMGEIYLAKQSGPAAFDRYVILKTLLPQYADDERMRNQFLDEGRIVGSINHPNVVAMFEVGEADGTFFIAMEHIHGVDFATLARESEKAGKQLPVRVVAAMVRDAALGLDAAHHAAASDGRALKIIHRDVSPQNIMVRRDGHVKVVDFGVAAAENKLSLSESGMLKGKFSYLTPEQIAGSEVDARCDQFALGAVVWEMLVGRRLFRSENQLDVFKLIMTESVAAPSTLRPDVPSGLDAAVLRLLERDPDRRFARCGDAAVALQAVVDELDGPMDEVAAYVESVVGEKLTRAFDAKPVERASTAGEVIVCARCGELRPAAKRFCSTCGADTGALGKGGAAAGHYQVFERVPGERDLVDLKSTPIRLDDREPTTPGHPRAHPAPVLVEPEPRVVTVVWYRLLSFVDEDELPEPAMAAGADELAGRLADLAANHGGVVVALTREAGVALFGALAPGANDADDAIRFALEMPRVLEDLPAAADGQVDLRAAVATGLVQFHADGVRGAPVNDAQRVCEVENRAAILVCQSTLRVSARCVPISARQVTVLDDNSDPFSAAELVGDRQSLPSPKVVGRERVLGELARGFEAAARSAAPAIIVLGDAGAGKSAVLGEAAALASWKGLVVARATCRSHEPACPLHDLRQLVRSLAQSVAEALRDTGSVALATERVSWRQGLALLGLADADQRRLRHLVSGAEPPEEMMLGTHRILLRASVMRLFNTAARRLGLCLLIDDLHAMDPLSLGPLTYTLSLLSGCRAICIATARPSLSPQLWPSVVRTTLEPLPPEALAEAVRATLSEPLGPRALAAVRERAAGNPTVAREAAQLLVARNLVARGPSGLLELRMDAERSKIPVTLAQIVGAEQLALGEGGRAEIRVQACFGEGWLPLAGTFTPAEVAAQQECLDSGLARSFTQPSIGDILRGSVDRSEIKAIHRALAARIAHALSSPGDALVDDHLRVLLAHHTAVADEPVRAHLAWLAAARAERDLGVGTTAEQFAALVLNNTPLTRNTLRAVGAGAPAALFEMAALATEALAEERDPQAPAIVTAILAMVAARSSPRAAAAAMRQQGRAFSNQGKLQEAENALEAALELAAFCGDAALEARIRVDFAIAIERGGDVAGAIAQLEAPLANLASLGAQANDLIVWQLPLQMAGLCISAGRFDEARAGIGVAQAEVLRTASLLGQAEVYETQASLAAAEGDADAAAACSAQAIAYADAVGDVLASVELRQAAASRLANSGRVEEAKQVLLPALDYAAAGAWPEGYSGTAALISRLTS